MAYRLLRDRRDAVRKWKEKNPDKVQAQRKRYRRRKGKKALMIYLRRWKKRNPRRVKLYLKRRREGYYD